MDDITTQWINAPAGNNPLVDSVIIAITTYGVPFVVLCVASQWWGQGDKIHVRHACVAAGVSFLTGLAFNQLLLLFVHRVRPYDSGVTHLIIPRSADWSFPSDHATAAFAVAVAFALQGLPMRANFFALAAALIAWSRVFVGTHYVTDVIGGAFTGIAAALLVRASYREDSKLDQFVTSIL
jgi:undecaprenyl-diphosphatase